MYLYLWICIHIWMHWTYIFTLKLSWRGHLLLSCFWSKTSGHNSSLRHITPNEQRQGERGMSKSNPTLNLYKYLYTWIKVKMYSDTTNTFMGTHSTHNLYSAVFSLMENIKAPFVLASLASKIGLWLDDIMFSEQNLCKVGPGRQLAAGTAFRI